MSAVTFAETGYFSCTLSLSGIIAGHKFSAGKATLRLREILERLVCGGWPGFPDETIPTLLEGFRDYLSSLVEVGLATGMGTGREPTRVRRLLTALAHGVPTEISIPTLALNGGLTSKTVSSHLATLTRAFAIEDPPAQSNHLHSKAVLHTEGGRPLTGSSLMVVTLQADPQGLLCDLRYTGQLLESQTIYDPRAYSGQLVRHARVSIGAGVNAVIGYPGGPLLLAEIKLGLREGVIETVLASLARFAAKIDSAPHPDVVRLIITGGAQVFTYPRRSQYRAIGCFD